MKNSENEFCEIYGKQDNEYHGIVSIKVGEYLAKLEKFSDEFSTRTVNVPIPKGISKRKEFRKKSVEEIIKKASKLTNQNLEDN